MIGRFLFSRFALFISDDLASRIICGKVKVKEDVKSFSTSSVEFVDGTVEDIDAVIFATGYHIRFPFMEKEVEKLVHERGFSMSLLLQPLRTSYIHTCLSESRLEKTTQDISKKKKKKEKYKLKFVLSSFDNAVELLL